MFHTFSLLSHLSFLVGFAVKLFFFPAPPAEAKARNASKVMKKTFIATSGEMTGEPEVEKVLRRHGMNDLARKLRASRRARVLHGEA